jgi:hypothetical protein
MNLLYISLALIQLAASAPSPQTAPKAANANSLNGINWFYAQAECAASQYADLQRAFLDVTDLAYAGIPAPDGGNPSFVDFFGVGYVGIVSSHCF